MSIASIHSRKARHASEPYYSRISDLELDHPELNGKLTRSLVHRLRLSQRAQHLARYGHADAPATLKELSDRDNAIRAALKNLGHEDHVEVFNKAVGHTRREQAITDVYDVIERNIDRPDLPGKLALLEKLATGNRLIQALGTKGSVALLKATETVSDSQRSGKLSQVLTALGFIAAHSIKGGKLKQQRRWFHPRGLHQLGVMVLAHVLVAPSGAGVVQNFLKSSLKRNSWIRFAPDLLKMAGMIRSDSEVKPEIIDRAIGYGKNQRLVQAKLAAIANQKSIPQTTGKATKPMSGVPSFAPSQVQLAGAQQQ